MCHSVTAQYRFIIMFDDLIRKCIYHRKHILECVEKFSSSFLAVYKHNIVSLNPFTLQLGTKSYPLWSVSAKATVHSLLQTLVTVLLHTLMGIMVKNFTNEWNYVLFSFPDLPCFTQDNVLMQPQTTTFSSLFELNAIAFCLCTVFTISTICWWAHRLTLCHGYCE